MDKQEILEKLNELNQVIYQYDRAKTILEEGRDRLHTESNIRV